MNKNNLLEKHVKSQISNYLKNHDSMNMEIGVKVRTRKDLEARGCDQNRQKGKKESAEIRRQERRGEE